MTFNHLSVNLINWHPIIQLQVIDRFRSSWKNISFSDTVIVAFITTTTIIIQSHKSGSVNPDLDDKRLRYEVKNWTQTFDVNQPRLLESGNSMFDIISAISRFLRWIEYSPLFDGD